MEEGGEIDNVETVSDVRAPVTIYVECMVCNRVAKSNRKLSPCGHSPTCEECSSLMAYCVICKHVIETVPEVNATAAASADRAPVTTFEVCMVCCKLANANWKLVPCGHSPACEDCSSVMAHCLICDDVIGTTECLVCTRVSMANKILQPCGHAPACAICSPVLLQCLICYKTIAGNVECVVCNQVSRSNVVLDPCGHAPACEDCSSRLTTCLICTRDIEREIPREQGELSGIPCDCCFGPVRGYRYRCVTCDNYEHCATCEGINSHPEHLMIRIRVTISVLLGDTFSKMVGHQLLEPLRNIRTFDTAMGQSHPQVCCNSCNCAPVVGYRYKCIRPNGYDLCQACERNNSHDEDFIIRIPRPLFFTLGDSSAGFGRMLENTLRKAFSRVESGTNNNFGSEDSTVNLGRFNSSTLLNSPLPASSLTLSQASTLTNLLCQLDNLIILDPSTPLETPIPPVQSIIPVAPTIPVQSIIPVAPTMPVQSIIPVAPTMPVQSIIPVAPTMPVQSIIPVAPTIPVQSIIPVAPTMPVQSIIPVAPTMPVQSIIPVAPTMPDAPTLLDVPVPPLNPAALISSSAGAVPQIEASRCLVCDASEADYVLPCGDSPACENCSVDMKECLICNHTIDISRTVCLMCSGISESNCELDPCGHRPVCDECSLLLTECLICNRVIVRRASNTCGVCSEVFETNNCTLEPCRHAPACEGCSANMTECFICNHKIDTRLMSDGRMVPLRDAQAERLQAMEAEIQELKDNKCCGICLDKQRNVVFQCGHTVCSYCSPGLTTCHICRRKIVTRINMFE